MLYRREILKIIQLKKRLLNIEDDIKSVEISLLGIGENHRNILVTVNKTHRFVFRIALHTVTDIKREHLRFLNLKLLPKDLGSRPLLFDASKKMLPEVYSILSYIDGKMVNRWNNTHLELHAKTLAKLHKRRFNYWRTTGKRSKVFDLYKKFIEEVNGFEDILNNPEIRLLLPKMKAYIKQNNHLFTELNTFCLIHGDTCNNNILFKEDRINYVDWEWLAIRDNAEDVARVYSRDFDMPPWFIKLSDKQINYFINIYLRNHPDKTLRKRVEVWNNMLLFTALLYFEWKLKHFKTEISVIPKKYYAHCVKVLINTYTKKFFGS